jgi:hypothetical protein
VLEDRVATIASDNQVQGFERPLREEGRTLGSKMVNGPSSPIGEITDEIAAKRTLIALVRKCPSYELFDFLGLS